MIQKMEPIKISFWKNPYGELILGSYQNKLCLSDWRFRKMRDAIDKRILLGLQTEFETESSDITELAKEQLSEYFAGTRKIFDIPLLLVGSDFQKHVWSELLQIPYGKTQTYLGLSKKMNNELAIRAVASANGANALSIFVPCHRVIGSHGELTGYAGGIPVKQKLLNLEGVKLNAQMSLFDFS